MGQLLRIEKWAENLEEVTLNRWLKEEGDRLEVGDTLCEIITDKATFEYEVEEAGTLLRKYATDKSVLPVGYIFAFVGEEDEQLPEGVEEENQRLMAAHQAATRADAELKAKLAQALQSRKTRATPAARRLAREKGVALEDVAVWLGEERPIQEEDVKAFLAQREAHD